MRAQIRQRKCSRRRALILRRCHAAERARQSAGPARGRPDGADARGEHPGEAAEATPGGRMLGGEKSFPPAWRPRTRPGLDGSVWASQVEI